MKKIVQSIFSIKKTDKHRQLTLFCLKIKFKLKKSLKTRIEELEAETKLLRTIIERSIDVQNIPCAKGNYRTVQLIKNKIT